MTTPSRPAPTVARGFDPEPSNDQLAASQRPADSLTPVPAPRAPRGGTVGRLLAMGALIGGIMLGGSLLIPTHESHDAWDVAAGTVSAVDIDVAAGDLTIERSSDGAVHFHEDVRRRGFGRGTEHAVHGSTLTIDTGASMIPGLGGGRARYILALPDGMALKVHQAAGAASLTGSFSTVAVEVSAGDLQGTDVDAKEFAAEVSAGSLTLANVDADVVTLTQSAGDARVGFEAAPDRLVVSVSAGKTTLTLPDEPYAVTQQASAGEVRVGVRTDATSPHTIKVDLSAGTVILDRA